LKIVPPILVPFALPLTCGRLVYSRKRLQEWESCCGWSAMLDLGGASVLHRFLSWQSKVLRSQFRI